MLIWKTIKMAIYATLTKNTPTTKQQLKYIPVNF